MPEIALSSIDVSATRRPVSEAAGVPLFFKQWGGHHPKTAGRILDGREWSEFPDLCVGEVGPTSGHDQS